MIVRVVTMRVVESPVVKMVEMGSVLHYLMAVLIPMPRIARCRSLGRRIC